MERTSLDSLRIELGMAHSYSDEHIIIAWGVM